MKYQIFDLRTPLKVVKTIEATSKPNALARAGYTNGAYGAVAVRESAGQSVRLQEQARRMELQPAIEAARQLLRCSEAFNPGAGDTHHVHATFPYGLPADSLESSFRQMGLSESAAKIAAKGR